MHGLMMPSHKSVPFVVLGRVEPVDTEQDRLALCLLPLVDVAVVNVLF